MTKAEKCVVVCGGFDDIRSSDLRFLQEASRFGCLHVLLFDDESLVSATGEEPKFPQDERLYFLQAIRFVDKVHLVTQKTNRQDLPSVEGIHPNIWTVLQSDDTPAKQAFCKSKGLDYRILSKRDLVGFPDTLETEPYETTLKKVLVTGCYDWFHSGHVRFLEEVSELGEVYVVVGHDANVRALKGQGHPMFPQAERRYMVQSIRFVRQALISTGHGWLDAEPELKKIKPDIYALNEDGNRPEKRKYCQEHGIEYIVLNRLPREGLPKRESSVLRGF